MQGLGGAQSPARHPLPEVNVKFKRATLERVEKFISDTYFTDVNLRGRLYPDKEPVTSIKHHGSTERFQLPAEAQGGRGAVKIGDSFGLTWATHWFHVVMVIPERFAGEEVRLRWNSGCEAMVYSMEHEPLQGLTELGGHERTDFILSRSALAGQRFEFNIEMACNPIFGAGDNGMINAPDPSRSFALSQCELAVFDRDCAALLHDLALLVDMAAKMDDRWPRSYQALYAANDIVNACRVGDRKSYRRCHAMAAQFFEQRNGASQLTLAAMGNCHIDCAWLWTYEETVRKCARSIASTIRLMDDYPEAQQYEWVKTHYPGLYDRMRKRIADGRFIPVGGTWVEMDANMPSGESFVRQFLVGQRFFKQEFGEYCSVFWLPDTFGYSGQLPQLMYSAGMRYFLTQKISWNLMNKFPHHSFKWQGIDGTQVLTHFPPAETYGAEVTVEEVLKSVTNLEDKGRVSESVMLYGYGDGGGGPTEDMLERMSRLKDCDGLPRIRPATPIDFFSKLDTESSSKLCTWVGEMYLELHNATYTTQGEIKKYNRVGEFLLRDAETAAALACVFGQADYPSDELLRIWKLFLLNQFHDVLPGTSIEPAHDLAKKYYKDVHQSAKTIFSSSLEALLKSLPASAAAPGVAIFNPFSWAREEVCAVPEDVTLPDATRVQQSSTGRRLAFVQAPSLGIVAGQDMFSDVASTVSVTEDEATGMCRLVNDFVQVDVDRRSGQLTSLIILKSGRESIPDGQTGNRLVIFDDVPLFWDAWDVMPYHLETREVLTDITDFRVVERGPLRVGVQFKLKISDKSSLVQTVSLSCNEEFVRFHNEVEWNENRRFLKVEFPTDISSMEAAYEMQFGHVRRPTHANTSWDVAKFEVCGHKWCDYSEYDFGVAVLSDCKYGYCVRNRVVRLSLLRAPKAPDAHSDMGHHEFSYALFPHQGTFQSAGVVRQSYNFSHPLTVTPTTGQKTTAKQTGNSWLQCDNPAIVLETVKKPEDTASSPALVLRFYEAFGGHASGVVHFDLAPLRVSSAKLCNILEEEEEADSSSGALSIVDQSIMLQLKPFQVATVLVHLATAP